VNFAASFSLPTERKKIDKCALDEHRGIKRSTICFYSAGNIDRVADDCKLQLLVAADVALDHLAIVNKCPPRFGSLRRQIAGSGSFQLSTDCKIRGAQRAALVASTGRGSGVRNTAIKPWPRNLSMLPL
jgi:hypothetical protein